MRMIEFIGRQPARCRAGASRHRSHTCKGWLGPPGAVIMTSRRGEVDNDTPLEKASHCVSMTLGKGENGEVKS